MPPTATAATVRLVVLLLLGSATGCTALDDDDGLVGGGTCGVSSAAPDVAAWSEEAAAFEQRVLELVNERRAQGGCCGGRGCFQPSLALDADDNLQAAARLHARDMAERDFFAHESPEGGTLLERAREAGFGGCTIGENIAQGQGSPEAVMDDWMASDGHCGNILSGSFTRLGVGYVDDAGAELPRLWVQNFGG